MVTMEPDTTRRIARESVLLLDELQIHLKHRGISVAQKTLIEKSIEIAAEHQEELASRLGKKQDNTRERITQLLKSIKPIDLGKNWLEEIDTTL
ncbi:MAG: hypothetical protein Q7R76_02690 [Candidatus Woesearchaeota archaeon]|nr:hypothetical protein [Candidatus Woesearchaeota archaeon]